MTKIAFYDTKPYDKTWFKPLAEKMNLDITFFETMRFVYLLMMRQIRTHWIFFTNRGLKQYF